MYKINNVRRDYTAIQLGEGKKDWYNVSANVTKEIYGMKLKGKEVNVTFKDRLVIGVKVKEDVLEKVVTHDVSNRSISMSYAKDLVCAGKVDYKDLQTTANEILKWVEGR